MKSLYLLALSTFFTSQVAVHAHNHSKDNSKPESEKHSVKVVSVSKNIKMLMGQGGNVGVVLGKYHTVLIDDQFAPSYKHIKDAVQGLSKNPIKFILNTHWHYDHTSGNEKFGNEGTIIVAHENVHKRLSVDNFIKAFGKEVKAMPEKGLPVLSFTRDVKFHLGKETMEVFHVKDAHTDGDAVVYFPESNVVHMGDLFFNGFYPFIDTQHGGSLDGMIRGGEKVLGMINNKTKIIPGHGPLAKSKDLKAFIAMLKNVKKELTVLLNNKVSLEDAIAQKPLKEISKKWGNGFLNEDAFVKIVYSSMIQ